MTNPVSQFRNGIFGSRGCNIQEAIDYANEMINTLPQTDQVGIRVGLGVLINTIDNAVTQAQGPSPEKLAIIELIDERISASQANVYTWIDMWASDNLRDKVMEMLAHDNVDDQISNWMSNNFDLDDYNVDGAIESWMDNNIDDKVYDAINSISFTVEIGR
jgi:hypothetical protein